MVINYTDIIRSELAGIYGSAVLIDMAHIIELYNFYDGTSQAWKPPDGLDYNPSMIRTNYVKKLIKEEARFMFGRSPEITIKAKDKKDEDAAKILDDCLQEILKNNLFKDKLIKAARDCFIGKRVAIKMWGDQKSGLKVMFRMSLEFVYDTAPDNIDEISKIVFFYQVNNEIERFKQRVWKQKFELINGKCFLNEGIYDGFGTLIQEIYTDLDTGLDFIPAKVILNDGLIGDLNGESDVEELIDGQNAYNYMKSDDVDALKFNMFPQKVAKNASGKSLEGMKITPGALVDLQAEDPDVDTDMKVLESAFSYNDRFENAINRIKNDMYDLLNIPNVGLEQLKGLMQSGKSMKAIYWGLMSRCEEKWCVWEPALEWMVKTIIKMVKAYNITPLPEIDYTVDIDHLYPIMEDEETERVNDLEEVKNDTRSRRNYMDKWGINEDTDGEMHKIVEELEMIASAGQDQFVQGLGTEGDNLDNNPDPEDINNE